jgi:hypothetical protein
VQLWAITFNVPRSGAGESFGDDALIRTDLMPAEQTHTRMCAMRCTPRTA